MEAAINVCDVHVWCMSDNGKSGMYGFAPFDHLIAHSFQIGHFFLPQFFNRGQQIALHRGYPCYYLLLATPQLVDIPFGLRLLFSY